MFNRWYWEQGDKVKRTVILHSLRLQFALLLAVTSCLSIFLCRRQISSCFYILALILYDFLSKAQLMYFPHHELSCIRAPSSLSPFLILLKFTLFHFFFLTFNNAERFKSRKIVLKLSVQCNFEEKKVPVSGEYEDTPNNDEEMGTSF